ncbi:MAG: CAF17-like 4Fe-4S cluster assembly/insertion protein YgfZ [Pseudoalteromonas sp.]
MSSVFACPLSDQLIEVSGTDKLAYLHGQITQDINKLTNDNFLWTGHCSSKGKLWGVFKLFSYKSNYYLVGSESEAAQSINELKKYAVFSKVEIKTSDLKLIGLLGDDLAPTLAVLGIDFSEQDAIDFTLGKALKLSDSRVLLILDKDASLPDSIPILDTDSKWQQQSIIAGEPQLNSDAIGEYVPQMVNLHAINGISFRKGCYTGQETVARMKYLGKNKRAMFIVKTTTDKPLDNLDLEVQRGENWRRAGKLISQSFDEQSNILFGLTVLPNDSDPSQSLRAKHAPEVVFSIVPLPYSLEDE